jgi:O-antigen/teichoic acid export membrane protein
VPKRSQVIRVLGFALIPITSAVAPLVALPSITREYGSEGWAAIAVGLATGTVAAAAAELGWGWNGPLRVARASARSRQRTLALAATTRFFAMIILAPAAAVLAYFFSPTYAWAAAVAGAGASMLGLSMLWYFIGTGRPWLGILLDSAPRLVFAVGAATVIGLGHPLWLYGFIALIVPSLLAPGLALAYERVRPADLARFNPSRIFRVVAAQGRVSVARTLSAGYIGVPVLLVGMVAPVQQLATFAAGDRVARMVLSGLTAAPNAFQRWVGQPSVPKERRKRAARAVAANACIGLAAGALSALLLPSAVDILFSKTVTLRWPEAAVLGGLIATVATSRAVGGIALAVAARQGALLASTIVGLVVGFPLVWYLGTFYGALGAFVAVLAAEAAVLTIQIAAWLMPKRALA